MRWELLCLLAACGADKYGAYLEVHGPAFDQVEFFFGGSFPARRCMNQAAQGAPPPNLTASWTRSMTQLPRDDQMFRRALRPSDVQKVRAGTTSFTYYVPPTDQDPDRGYPSGFGAVLVVVASSGGNVVGVARVDNLAINDGEVDQYTIGLQPPPAAGAFEIWGLGDAGSCLRWTAGDGTSLFVTREWDRDCDGLQTKNCDYDGTGLVWDDCDPLSFCRSDGTGCQSHEGCYIPGAASATDAMTCMLGTCSNVNGARAACGSPIGTYCLGADACSQQTHCDRDLASCVMTDSTPDLTCQVPVDDNGDLCATSPAAPIELYPALQGACGTIQRQQQRIGSDPPPMVGFATAPDPNMSCALVMTPMTSGFLPTMRLLILRPGSVTAVDQGSLLVELDPARGDCSDPTPQCDPTPPVSHACPAM